MPTFDSLMQNFKQFPAEGLCARVRCPLAAVAGAVMALCSAGVLAQTASASRLSETVVTATRTESKVDETLADVTVITGEQIREMAPSRSVAEVLQRLAGVQISSNGGRGNTQSVFLRGNDANKTLLLIDGVRYGSATMGTPALENLPLELIDRIEVVQGPASALYGSEAIGGVIQIFTKRGKGAGKPFLGQGSVTVGEYGHKSANAGLRGEQAGFDYNLNISRVVEHGISATNEKAGSSFNPDRDGFAQTAVNAGLGYAFNSDWRVDTTLMKSEGRAYTDTGPGSNPYVDLRTQTGRVQLTGKLLSNWTSRFSVGQSKDKQVNLGSGWDSHFDTTQTEYKWDNELATPIGKVLAGLERLEQKVDTSSNYDVNKRSINAAFVGINGGVGRHSWQANVRRDDNSQFGGFTTYGAGYGLEVVNGVRVYASHGKSMRAPSFNDLYYPPDPYYPSYNGNPLLKPEQAKNNEIGVQWSSGGQRAKLLHFDNRVTNLIQGGTNQMENVAGTTRLKGWRAEYGFSLDGWTLSSAYDYLDPKTRDGKPLLRRAKNQFALNLDKSIGAWKLGGSMLYASSRSDTDYSAYPARPVTLPSYTTLDVYAEYRINPEWTVQARIANLTNKQYETAYGYNQLGRAGYLTLKWAMH